MLTLALHFEGLGLFRLAVEEDLEFVLAGGPAIGLRDVEFGALAAARRNRARRFIDRLAVLIGPFRAQGGRLRGAIRRDRGINRVARAELVGAVGHRLVAADGAAQ